MAWTDNTISRFAQSAETNIVVTNKLIVDRISLALTTSVNQYQVPTYVLDIRRITYKGYPLEPYSGKELLWSGSTPKTISSSQPRFYTYSDFGQRIIKLFPAPPEDIAQYNGDLWDTTGIENYFIVEFFRSPDFTTSTLRMPEEIRRQYVKSYVMRDCFKQEGKGQDIKASDYYAKKIQMEAQEIKLYLTNLKSSIVSSMQPQIQEPYGRKPGLPQLPPQFGVRVS